MQYSLRDYQQLAVDHALSALREGTTRVLYAAPTGSGKSVIELAVRAELLADSHRPWIVTPRLEIVAGLLAKLGVPLPSTELGLISVAWGLGITTPIRLRNALIAGNGPPVSHLILDECHHDAAESWRQLDMLTSCPRLGYTATPYRGTPQSTAVLREHWGEPVWILDYPQAARRGVIAVPDCRMLPLVDDDVIAVSAGELQVSQITSEYADRLRDLAEYSRRYIGTTSLWDRPTVFSVSSVATAKTLALELSRAECQAVAITQENSHAQRQAAFAACINRTIALVQVKVISEGVDLPLRRLIDCAPCLSPVAWLQQFGRITRPVPAGESPPEYICTNRNLARHAYLLDGLIPESRVGEAQQAFAKPSKRPAPRAVGLEGVGRLKPAEVMLKSGIVALVYAITGHTADGWADYTAIIHPAREDVIWATRYRDVGPDGITAIYGRWQRCPPPADLSGFSSLPSAELTEKQEAWWKRSAAGRGLDATVKPTRKTFQALPVLLDIKARL